MNISKIQPKQILSFLLAIITGIMFFRFFIVVFPKNAQEADTKKGVEYLAAMESVDGNKAAEEVRAVQKSYTRTESNTNARQTVKDDNFRPAFKGILIVGDSIIQAMNEFNVLDPDQALGEIGANTEYIGREMKNIVKMNPKVIVLHFGANLIEGKSYAAPFINNYEKQIKTLKKKLPKAKIYVDAILPVTKHLASVETKYQNIAYYNSCIKKMAKRLNVTYIEQKELWTSKDEHYFDADGMHPVKLYYTEEYLPFILDKVGADVG